MQSLRRKYRSVLRYRINKKNRDRLQYDPENPFSIISSNCIGGVISHELGLRFESPTVNLFFYPDSYLEFISHLREYSSMELLELPQTPEYSYPRGKLGSDGKVVIHFMHYESFEEAKLKWNERCKRINYNNLYFILAERDGITYEQMEAFERLPYKNKILLTCHEYSQLKYAFCLGGYTENNELMDLCRYKGRFTGERYLDDFDYVGFLNRESRCVCNISDEYAGL